MLKNIGKLEGELLVFGGVYSNLQALETLMEIAEKKKIPASNIICTGDIVAYCAQPEECVQAVKEWGIHAIAGNVEIQLREGLDDCGCDFQVDSRCDFFAKQWFPYAKNRVSKGAITWMDTLPTHIQFEYAGKTCFVLHGSYTHVSEFIFKSTPWQKKQESFDATGANVILAGHCGLPFNDVQNGKMWLNAGVIGMPANDGTSRVWYMLIQAQESTIAFQHCHFLYDFDETFAQMLENELPIDYAKTLSSGLWDNCDILPDEETAAQGKELIFQEMVLHPT